MTILCGTDFTPPAAHAARVAEGWARRTGQKLVLLHALPVLGAEIYQHGTGLEALRLRLAQELGEAASGMQSRGVECEWRFAGGESDEELVRAAHHEHAKLVVVGALGRRAGGLWTLGSTADRVAQHSRVPVLVVRSTRDLEPWLRGERPLKVLCALERSKSSDVALRWAAGLARLGAIELDAAHVYSPAEEQKRRGLHGALPIGMRPPEIEVPLAGELAAHVGRLGLADEPRLHLASGLGRPADRFLELADELKPDLLVVGNHQREGFERFWHGSFSHTVLAHAKTSVAVVGEHG